MNQVEVIQRILAGERATLVVARENEAQARRLFNALKPEQRERLTLVVDAPPPPDPETIAIALVETRRRRRRYGCVLARDVIWRMLTNEPQTVEQIAARLNVEPYRVENLLTYSLSDRPMRGAKRVDGGWVLDESWPRCAVRFDA